MTDAQKLWLILVPVAAVVSTVVVASRPAPRVDEKPKLILRNLDEIPELSGAIGEASPRLRRGASSTNLRNRTLPVSP
jgi:hypothetical protein